MCDERERLIEFLYGEAGPADRAEVEAHLGGCHECRAEIAALRGVRNDLLAWEVPDHEQIWRPVPAAPPVPFWHRVPGWALAAAATLVFATGVAGGMATRLWAPAPTATVAAAAPADPQSIALTPADLARLKAEILASVRDEMNTRLEAVSMSAAPVAAPVPASLAAGREGTSDLVDRVAAIERWRDDQITLNAVFNGQVGRLNRVTSDLNDFAQQASRIQPVSFNPGGR